MYSVVLKRANVSVKSLENSAPRVKEMLENQVLRVKENCKSKRPFGRSINFCALISAKEKKRN